MHPQIARLHLQAAIDAARGRLAQVADTLAAIAGDGNGNVAIPNSHDIVCRDAATGRVLFATNPDLHTIEEGEALQLVPMNDRAPILWRVPPRPAGTLALYWIGYSTIPAVWQIYRLLPDLVTLETLGKPSDFADDEMTEAGFMFTITGALVIGAGTSGVSAFRLWRDGIGWQTSTAPSAGTSWGLRRNVRLGGSLYTIRGQDVASVRYIYIWKLTALPDTWTLVVTQQCSEMTDIECAWPVEPATEGDNRYILLATVRSPEPSPLLYSEGRVFWRLRVPNDGEGAIADQHNPAALMPLSTSPYNMSVRRTVETEYYGVDDGATPWFVGEGARDFSVGPITYYPPIAARYDAASNAWVDQDMDWAKPAAADPVGEYYGDQGFVWGNVNVADLFDAEDNVQTVSAVRDGPNQAFAPTSTGWMHATFDGGSAVGESVIHGGSLNTTLQSASTNAHSGPPTYDTSADEATPSKRFIRQQPGLAAEVLASMTIDGTGTPNVNYDATFGFHGVAVTSDGTVLVGIGKGASGNVSLAHPTGSYGYPNGGVYFIHPSGALLAWPPLQSSFNGPAMGVLRLYSSEDEV